MKKKIFSICLLLVITTISILYYSTYLQTNAEVKQQKVYKIGILTTTEERLAKTDGMRDGFKQYGLSDDNVDFIIKNSYEDIDILEDLAQELVDYGVDIIVTTGTSETAAAKEVTKESKTPVVFIGVGCTVELGLVEDSISTGCNITGIDSHYVQLSGKRIEFLKRLVPSTKKVLVLYNPTTTPFGASSVFLYEAAEKFNIDLDIIPVNNKNEIIDALNKKSDGADGVMIMCSLLFESNIDSITEITLEKQIPVIGVLDRQVEEGVLAFYGSTSYNEGVQASRIVANILRGQDPEIVPIESPEQLELHINVDTAEKLGIDIETLKMPFVDRFVHSDKR